MTTPAGKPGLFEQLGQLQRADRRQFGRLENDRAAGGKCRTELPACRHEGHVPGRYRADDADGQPRGKGMDAVVERDRRGRPACRRARRTNDRNCGGRRRPRVTRAAPGHCPGTSTDSQFRRMFLVEIGEAAHEGRPLMRRHAPPRSLEGSARGRHRAIDVLLAAIGHQGPRPSGRGVDAFEQAAIFGRDPFATDKQILVADEFCRRTPRPCG